MAAGVLRVADVWLQKLGRGSQWPKRLPINLLKLSPGVAYLAQHLIVLLDPADIVINLHRACRRPEFRDRHCASFHTGPSATADIEGVLIHGAQGVRSLSVLPLTRAAGNPVQ